ncbi:MAG: urea ABC transporter substrate-binding protein [Patescibacteria group bacterium]
MSGKNRQQFKEKNVIKVGILHSLSGTMAMSETSLVDAYLMAIDEINERGGVLGKRLMAKIVDGASDPERFAEEAKVLITKEGVRSVFGGWTSASRKTMKPVFEKYENLLWYPVQYEGLEQSPNIVYTGAAPNQQVLPAVDWVFKNLGRRFFLVGSDYVFPRAANEIIKERIHEIGGEIVGEEYRVLGSTDFRDVVKAIQAAKPDVILNTINGDSNLSFFELLRNAGIRSSDIPTISFSIAEEEINDMELNQVIGDYAVWNYFQSLESEANQKFISNFKKKYGKDRVVDDPIEAAYNSVHLFAKAVEKAQSEDPADIRKALGGLSLNAPEGRVEIDADSQHVYRAVRVGKIDIDGQFEIVWNSDKSTKPEPYPVYRDQGSWNKFLNDLYVGWGKRWFRPLGHALAAR